MVGSPSGSYLPFRKVLERPKHIGPLPGNRQEPTMQEPTTTTERALADDYFSLALAKQPDLYRRGFEDACALMMHFDHYAPSKSEKFREIVRTIAIRAKLARVASAMQLVGL